MDSIGKLKETGEDMRMPRNSNDVLVKHLSTALPDSVLDVIGVRGVHIERVLPTELDSVDVRQEFTDVVWEWRSGAYSVRPRPRTLHMDLLRQRRGPYRSSARMSRGSPRRTTGTEFGAI